MGSFDSVEDTLDLAGFSECNGFGQRRFRLAAVRIRFDVRMQHPRAGLRGAIGFVYLELRSAQEASSPSYKLMGWLGMIVEIACL